MRIALAASLIFAALWFVALRPKPVEENVDDPLPTVSAEEVDKGSAKADAAATPDETKKADTAPKAAAEKQPVAKKPAVTGPKAVVADLAAGRTVVLLFSKLNATTDDREVRQAVAGADRHDGKVRIHRARIDSLPKYEAVTKSVPVTTSPTILVISGKSKQAQVLTGLTTTREIDQTIRVALKQ